ncbi:unnamed protein product [Discula destructiva]
MAKLPTSLLARSLPSSTSTLLTTTARPTISSPPTRAASAIPIQRPSQVRHATAVARPKRPFTWTQIVQLSDGSTYTTRTTSPQSVYRSTKDTRNHLTWQPSDPSLQNVEVDEAGKMAGFRQRFGTAFDMAPGAALAAQEMKEDAERNAAHLLQKKGRKNSVAEAEEMLKIAGQKEEEAKAAAEEEAAEDSFASLLTSYVRDQPSLSGGQVAGKGFNSKNKKKK